MDKNKKTYTSQNFVRRPLEVFRSAYNGCRTIINHAQYPEGVFELTYRKREPCFSEQPAPSNASNAPDEIERLVEKWVGK